MAQQTSERITVVSGGPATLKCPWDYNGSLFWVRIIPGKLPEVLGKTFGPEPTNQRIKITEEIQGSFLRIARTATNDTGYYYCMNFLKNKIFFSKEIHLSVNGNFNENYVFYDSPISKVAVYALKYLISLFYVYYYYLL